MVKCCALHMRKVHDLINQQRLTSDLKELGQIGRLQRGGITRHALTNADREARHWLSQRMREAGLSVSMDGSANVIGTLDCGSPRAPSVVIGSHLDTVPQGGMFDGALGVLAGLECARAIQEQGETLPWHLQVINFTDEEGYYNAGTFGSRAMLGMVSEEELYQHKTGTTCIADALTALNLSPASVLKARRPVADFRAYFELHIEQSTRLERGGYDVGIVTGITGIYRYLVSILGQAGHAGTTPMPSRDDALVKAAPLFSLLPEWCQARTSELVATIGQVELVPGAVNVIPGECKCTVELRAMDSEHMRKIKERLASYVEERPPSHMSVVLEKDSVPMDATLVSALEEAARCVKHCRMPSWAGHDAQSFATNVPTAMLFVPSQNGASHCPEEWTEFEQAARGAQVLLDAICQLAKDERTG